MIRHPNLLSLFLAIALAIAASVMLWLVVQITLEQHIVVFAAVLTATFFLSRFILDTWVLRPLSEFKRRLVALGIGDDDPAPGTRKLIKAMEEDIARYAAHSRGEVERLRKLEAFRRDFIADVSHELKTPIFAAQGFVHTLLDGAVKEKSVRKKFLKKAAKSLDGLDVLVQDLLTLSHIETGQIRMRFEHFDLYALVEEVFEPFRVDAEKKGLVLRIVSGARRVPAYADRLRIHQVLTNLVSNAIKHSGEGREVLVTLETRRDSVIVRVQDFGEGIPEEHIHRIFERFYRVDKSRSREKGGTGLGLAIVKHILDSHRTSAEVESTPGEGSVFSFALPTRPWQLSTDGEFNESGKDQGAEEAGY